MHLHSVRLRRARAVTFILALASIASIAPQIFSRQAVHTDAGNHAAPAINAAKKINAAQLPISFEANQGQQSRAGKFIARGQGYHLSPDERGAEIELTG